MWHVRSTVCHLSNMLSINFSDFITLRFCLSFDRPTMITCCDMYNYTVSLVFGVLTQNYPCISTVSSGTSWNSVGGLSSFSLFHQTNLQFLNESDKECCWNNANELLLQLGLAFRQIVWLFAAVEFFDRWTFCPFIFCSITMQCLKYCLSTTSTPVRLCFCVCVSHFTH